MNTFFAKQESLLETNCVLSFSSPLISIPCLFAEGRYTIHNSKQHFSFLEDLPSVFTSKGSYTEPTITNSVNSMMLETNTLFITEKPVLNKEMNTNYLTVGVGVIIAMLFFIILKQFCKPSHYSNRKPFFHRKRNIDPMCDESSNRPHKSNEKEYKFISSSQEMFPNYQQMNTVYHEIDECMEINEPSDYLNAETDLGGNTDRFEFRNLTSVVKNDDINSQTSSLYLLPCTSAKSIGSETDKSDLYLQPICILENNKQEEKEETHSYTDVTG